MFATSLLFNIVASSVGTRITGQASLEKQVKHCKLIYCKHRIIRVVMLNLRGYDSHLIIIHAYAINNQIRIRKIDVIQNDIDKLMTYSIKHVKLKDSFQIMPSSFDEFVVNLYDEHDMFSKKNMLTV